MKKLLVIDWSIATKSVTHRGRLVVVSPISPRVLSHIAVSHSNESSLWKQILPKVFRVPSKLLGITLFLKGYTSLCSHGPTNVRLSSNRFASRLSAPLRYWKCGQKPTETPPLSLMLPIFHQVGFPHSTVYRPGYNFKVQEINCELPVSSGPPA